MPKENTMWKLFWALYKDLSELERLKVIELMVRNERLERERIADDSKNIKEP